MERYVIKREDIACLMLANIEYGMTNGNYATKTVWIYDQKDAIITNADEANRIITFIRDVIDWELGEQLYIEKIES